MSEGKVVEVGVVQSIHGLRGRRCAATTGPCCATGRAGGCTAGHAAGETPFGALLAHATLQVLDAVRDEFRRVALLAVLTLPLAGLHAAFHVHLVALAQV